MQSISPSGALPGAERRATITRNSFIRQYKLHDVKGKADYISSPARQEHLYAAYSTVEPRFWEELAQQNQYDHKRYGSEGKCIEARELVIALPESFVKYDPNALLQLFTETFRTKYGVQCASALHHNKAMTNYHIHLIYAERKVLEQKTIKRASRNMFYDEDGRHVRTKKEILDGDGNIRSGCRIVPKGEIYDMNFFGPKESQFKQASFLREVKILYTDLINQFVETEQERLQVFDPNDPYLPTKKVGKNNPMASAIEADNAVRREWNRTVEQALIEGVPEEEILEYRQKEIRDKITESIAEHGNDPKRFSDIVRKALGFLKELIAAIMERPEKSEAESIEEAVPILSAESKKGPRPSSEKEEADLRRMQPIHDRMRKYSKRIYAIGKQIETVQLAMDSSPKGLFHLGERKALQNRIDELQSKIQLTEMEKDSLASHCGYQTVRDCENAYWRAKDALDKIRTAQDIWDGKSPRRQRIRPSIRKQLEAAASAQKNVSGKTVSTHEER